MARVKSSLEASSVTIDSKWQRYERIKRLFGIRRLGDLFPKDATPNGAANDPTVCSGDVLRDLCQIGEALRVKGIGRAQRVERVKGSFKEGVLVRHVEIRDLLAKVKKNEFEERLKGARYDGGEMTKEEEEEMMGDGEQATATTSTEGFGRSVSETSARLNRFERDTPTIYDKEDTKQNKPKPTKPMNPGFATADQIRADFRRRSDTSILKRKRPTTSIGIVDESLINNKKNTTPKPINVDLNDIEDDLAANNAKRTKTTHLIYESKLSNDPLPTQRETKSTHRQLRSSTSDTEPQNFDGRANIVGENDITSQHEVILDSLKGINDVVGRAQDRLKGLDVESTAGLLVEARNLIASAFATFGGA